MPSFAHERTKHCQTSMCAIRTKQKGFISDIFRTQTARVQSTACKKHWGTKKQSETQQNQRAMGDGSHRPIFWICATRLWRASGNDSIINAQCGKIRTGPKVALSMANVERQNSGQWHAAILRAAPHSKGTCGPNQEPRRRTKSPGRAGSAHQPRKDEVKRPFSAPFRCQHRTNCLWDPAIRTRQTVRL